MANPKKQTSDQKFVLALTQDEVNLLNQMLNEIPGKFCNPVFQFFNQVLERRKQEQKPKEENNA